MVYLRNYLDEDQDNSVSQEEFVDKKALPLISSIFNALDQNSDNIVELSEAWMENVLSPKFIRFLSQELFKFGDLNRDNFLSNEDIPEAFKPGAGANNVVTMNLTGSFERDNRINGRRWGSTYFEFKMKFNKSLSSALSIFLYFSSFLLLCSFLCYKKKQSLFALRLVSLSSSILNLPIGFFNQTLGLIDIKIKIGPFAALIFFFKAKHLSERKI